MSNCDQLNAQFPKEHLCQYCDRMLTAEELHMHQAVHNTAKPRRSDTRGLWLVGAISFIVAFAISWRIDH